MELLVVIAIIVLLVSIIVPALASVRNAARSAKCLTQLRSNVQLCAGFASDHRGQAPIAGRLWNHTVAQLDGAHLPAGLPTYYESGPSSAQRPVPFFAALAEHSGVVLDHGSKEAMRAMLGYPGLTQPGAESFFQLTRCPDDRTFNPADISNIGISLMPGDTSWTAETGLGELSSYVVNEYVLGESSYENRLFGRIDGVASPGTSCS